jgi:O-antigen/teichoic acid export membrane protein
MIIFGLLLIVRSFEIVYYYLFNSMAIPKIFIYSVLIVAIVTNSLYILLIPYFKEVGMVIASLIANIISILFVSYHVNILYKKNKKNV